MKAFCELAKFAHLFIVPVDRMRKISPTRNPLNNESSVLFDQTISSFDIAKTILGSSSPADHGAAGNRAMIVANVNQQFTGRAETNAVA